MEKGSNFAFRSILPPDHLSESNVQLMDCTEWSNNVIIDRWLYWMFKQAKKEYLSRWVQFLPKEKSCTQICQRRALVRPVDEVGGWCCCWLTTAPPSRNGNSAITPANKLFISISLPVLKVEQLSSDLTHPTSTWSVLGAEKYRGCDRRHSVQCQVGRARAAFASLVMWVHSSCFKGCWGSLSSIRGGFLSANGGFHAGRQQPAPKGAAGKVCRRLNSEERAETSTRKWISSHPAQCW